MKRSRESFFRVAILLAITAILVGAQSKCFGAIFETGSYTDTGTNVCLEIDAGGLFSLTSSVSGEILVEIGRVSQSYGNDIILRSGAMLSAGNSTGDSGFSIRRGALVLDGGTAVVDTVTIYANGAIRGAGAISGNITNISGLIAPGFTNAPGKLVSVGALRMENDSALEIHIEENGPAGDAYDLLENSDDLLLGGTLNVYLAADCNPSNQLYKIISSSSSIAGIFNNVSSYGRVPVVGGGSFHYSTNSNAIVLSGWSLQAVPAPEAPTAQAATGVSRTIFNANWSRVLYATNYLLDVAETDSFGPSDFLPGYDNLAVGNSTTFKVENLDPGRTYYYRVRAQGEGGLSKNSSALSVTTSVEATGTISIDVTPDSGIWTFSAYPAAYTGQTAGTGDLATVAAPTGSYTVVFSTLPGYRTPSARTGLLEEGGNLPFAGVYVVIPTNNSAVLGDFTGDGCTDMTIYNPDTGIWYIRSVDGTIVQNGEQWGGQGYVPVLGDYDGDGVNDQTVYDTVSGNWFIRFANEPVHKISQPSPEKFEITPTAQWGGSGFTPITGDYDGDGTSDLAVYHQASGNWYIRTIAGRILCYGEQWGGNDMIPVTGDYDGDGTSDLAVYHQATGNWYIRKVEKANEARSSKVRDQSSKLKAQKDGTFSFQLSAFNSPVQWGGSGFTPVAGDYDGDGADDLAVYEQATGNWYIRKLEEVNEARSSKVRDQSSKLKAQRSQPKPDQLPVEKLKGQSSKRRNFQLSAFNSPVQWGGSVYEALSGDYNGDGISDLAVYDIQTGQWYIMTVSETEIVIGAQWGDSCFSPVTTSAGSVPQNLMPAYRFYNSSEAFPTCEHIYTINIQERTILSELPAWSYEGVAWYALADCSGDAVPLYRLYHEILLSHYYTIDEADYNRRVNEDPFWIPEGIQMYVWSSVNGFSRLPAYRFYQPDTGVYFYTIDENEKSFLISNDQSNYVFEGISFYVYSQP